MITIKNVLYYKHGCCSRQMHKRKADDLASKLPKKKVKVVRMSCKTCRKAQGLCKYIGQPGHLVQNGYIYHHIYLNRGLGENLLLIHLFINVMDYGFKLK